MFRNICVVVVVCAAVVATPSFGQSPCSWAPLGSGLDGSVRAMAVFDDGAGPALHVGGVFTTAGGAPADHIAKWDGAAWSPLGSGAYGSINAMLVFDGGSGPGLYVAYTQPSSGWHGTAMWNGASWSSHGSLGSFQATDLVAFADNTGASPSLYVAATDFLGWVGLVARFDGSSWSPVGVMDGPVDSLEVFDGGAGPVLCAGGRFTWVDAVFADGIASWDGSSWLPLAPTGGFTEVQAMTVFDDGAGPALWAATDSPVGLWRWDGMWSLLGPLPGGSIHDLAVFDDGSGPAIYSAGVECAASPGPPWCGTGSPYCSGRVDRWDGASWSFLGNWPYSCAFSIVPIPAPPGVHVLTTFDDGTGPALYAGGWCPFPGVVSHSIAKWSCPSTITVSTSQPGGPGAPLHVANANLTPYREYFNLVSIDLCPGGPGTGPGPFGACLNPTAFQFLAQQLSMPVGTPPFHIIAPSSYVVWPPLTGLPPITVDAICIDMTGGVIGPVSPVVRIVVQ